MRGNGQRRTKQQNICMQIFALLMSHAFTVQRVLSVCGISFLVCKNKQIKRICSLFKGSYGASKNKISYRNKNIVLLIVLIGHIVVLFCYIKALYAIMRIFKPLGVTIKNKKKSIKCPQEINNTAGLLLFRQLMLNFVVNSNRLSSCPSIRSTS